MPGATRRSEPTRARCQRRDRRADRRRREDEQVRPRAAVEHVAERDQAAERMPVQDERPAPARSNGRRRGAPRGRRAAATSARPRPAGRRTRRSRAGRRRTCRCRPPPAARRRARSGRSAPRARGRAGSRPTARRSPTGQWRIQQRRAVARPDVVDLRLRRHRREPTPTASARYDAAMNWQEVGDRVFTRHFDFLDQQIGVVLGGRGRPGRRHALDAGARARDRRATCAS